MQVHKLKKAQYGKEADELKEKLKGMTDDSEIKKTKMIKHIQILILVQNYTMLWKNIIVQKNYMMKWKYKRKCS